MLTIPNAVEEVIKKKPFLEGALVEGLINLSALARQLKPEIEKQVGKSVNDSAVIMALNRLVPRLELMSPQLARFCLYQFGDAVRKTGNSPRSCAQYERCILYILSRNLRNDFGRKQFDRTISR